MNDDQFMKLMDVHTSIEKKLDDLPAAMSLWINTDSLEAAIDRVRDEIAERRE